MKMYTLPTKEENVYPCNSIMKMCTLIIKEEDVYPSN